MENKIGKIIITKQVSDIIDTLHNKIGAKEWSGVLFYTLKSGKIQNLKDLVFEAKYIYPMDIGTTVATSFEYSGELLDVYDIYPELMDCNTGISHSHHNMTAYHSQTDMNELDNNSGAYNYYISLVVNFAKTPVCKIGFPVENSIVSTMLDENGNKFSASRIKKGIEIFDLDVEYECANELSWLTERIGTLKKKNTPQPVIPSIYNYGTSFQQKIPVFTDPTPTTFISKYTSNNYAKQFIVNLCNLAGHGDTIDDALKSIEDITDPEDVEIILNNLDAQFEQIYFNTFETEEMGINPANILASLTELMKFDNMYNGKEIYDSLKNQLILYL